jgi:predicted glycogen debranching enzyme
MREEREWLEVDGLGGFAMGTSTLIPRRKYHALLVTSVAPPTSRYVLINCVDASILFEGNRYPLSSFQFASQIVHPKGSERISEFKAFPWPHWTFSFNEIGLSISHELFVKKGSPLVVLSWRQLRGRSPATLEVRPLLSVRDYHSLHRQNSAFCFNPAHTNNWVEWSPYSNVPSVSAYFNGEYNHSPCWYKDFLYKEEMQRGYDSVEDLASPGLFTFDLSQTEAFLVFVGGSHESLKCFEESDIVQLVEKFRQEETRRRSSFPSDLHRAADSYVVERGEGKTIIAGYPWFTDWGRDTFISIRGICIAGGRLDDAAKIFKTWIGTLSQGMIPNRFPDSGNSPEYNSVDASLWFVVAAYEFIKLADATKYASLIKDLKSAIFEVLNHYQQGTRFRINCDEDGLLRAGLLGTQLTWMDAKYNHLVFTPRVGKPVEIQALWINALLIGAEFDTNWEALAKKATSSFEEKFWNPQLGMLFDVVDVDNNSSVHDPSFRPNQIFSVGGLPFQVLEGDKARSVVDAVERELLTSFGLRTLNRQDVRFSTRYEGTLYERDSAYHQGTVWPWLLASFVDAWLRVRNGTEDARIEAKNRFLTEIMSSIEDTGGVGHLYEIHDATSPYRGRGCPFQAWSIAEVLRLFYQILIDKNRQQVKKQQAVYKEETNTAMSS